MKTNGWAESFRTKYLFIFGPLKSISDESKSMCYNQNCVLFLNMSLEILCQFLFESSEIIFERPKKLVWTERVDRSFWSKCLFILARLEVFQTSQNYGLRPEFCALSGYEPKNVVSVFVRKQWGNLWKT